MPSIPSPEPQFVASRDGTRIAYFARGSGPGLVLIHGAMQSAHNFSRLAEALSGSFTTIAMNRRGREPSGPFGATHGLATEVEDVSALLTSTGARYVFGLSSGAIIALNAACELPAITKLAIYEPPLDLGGARPAAWVPRYTRELRDGNLAAAMATVLKGTGDVEPFTYVPRVLFVPMLRLMLGQAAEPGRPSIRALIPTVEYDGQIQHESAVLLPRLAAITAELMILGGSRSHRALRRSVAALSHLLPRAERVQLRGVGHIAADDLGRPERVADALRTFFEAP